ncbi:helix-turn-helix domain-containing protein [Streptomyces sp. NPDC090127]|uniref:helix-turn-helix domain-containing protein n=1 Tax=Streptomyces sp. NPDC090127 TaxID=3365953 RepID=UPI0038221DD6
MYGLTSSPAHPPSEAESAPALLARLDALFGSVADADELVRAAARVADCTAGMAHHGRVLRRCPAGGLPEAAGEVTPSTRRLVTVDGHAVGEVWVERPGEPLPFDTLLTERLALAAAALVARGGGVATAGADTGGTGRGPRLARRTGGPASGRGVLPPPEGPTTAEEFSAGEPEGDRHRLAASDPYAASGGHFPSDGRSSSDPYAAAPDRLAASGGRSPSDPYAVASDGLAPPDPVPSSGQQRVWWPAGLGDPALVQAVLSPSMPETQRSRALHLLGLPPAGPMRAAAVVVAEPGSLQGALRVCAAELYGPPSTRTGGTAPYAALWPRVGALLLPGPGTSGARPGRGAVPARGPLAVGRGVAVGLGPAVAPERLAESWAQARRAVRFAGLGPTWPRLVDAAELGAQVLLADIPEDAALAHPDVAAVARLEAEPDGPQMLATLEAVCRTRSLREAAKLLSLHHSSVAHRVARAERALAMSLSDPSERQRAHTAVLLWRLNAPDNWRN